MRRMFAAISLMLLSGCGSCLEDKKTPEVEPTGSAIKTVEIVREGGAKRVQVGDNVGFAGVVKRDGGADGGS